MQLSRGRSEKREALEFLEEELRRQPHTGEGLIAFVSQSHQVYADQADPEDHQDCSRHCEDILDDRPDLWQAWSVVIQQMAGLSRLEEANALAREATDRFPLLAKLWLDRAQVVPGDGERRGSARFAAAGGRGRAGVVAGGPRTGRGARRGRANRMRPSLCMERAAARNPLDPFAHGFLAERLWEAGRSREALDRAKTAVRHEPGYDWAWHAVQLWSERLEVPDEPADLARELTRDRSGDPRVWLRLARLLHHPRHNDEVLAALDRAIALDPKNVEAHDLKAERLAEMGRYDDALAAAQPPAVSATDLPLVLQGRAAWVEARRGNYAAAIPPMQALVAVDPNYLWGWHQLAEWYNETGRAENYLEAASELVRLQPGHPVALTMRGEAKLQTGDRDGGKADLREALKVSPGLLARRRGPLRRLPRRRRIPRSAGRCSPCCRNTLAGPEVAVKQIQLACRTDDADGAVRAFAEVCEGPGQSPFPIQAGARPKCKTAGLGGTGRRACCATRGRAAGRSIRGYRSSGSIRPTGQEAEPGERLARRRGLHQGVPEVHARARLQGRATRARPAGSTRRSPRASRPDFDPLPVELRGRAAWVENRRGDRAKAIALMRQLVAGEPELRPRAGGNWPRGTTPPAGTASAWRRPNSS